MIFYPLCKYISTKLKSDYAVVQIVRRRGGLLFFFLFFGMHRVTDGKIWLRYFYYLW